MDKSESVSRSVSQSPPANTFFSTRAVSGFCRLFWGGGSVVFGRSKEMNLNVSSRSVQPKRYFGSRRDRSNLYKVSNYDRDYTNRMRIGGGSRPDREPHP